MEKRKTTDLHKTIENNDEKGIKELVASHPDWMSFKDEELGRIPLTYALGFEVPLSEDIVIYLANATPKESLNDQDDDGWTALMRASFEGYHQVVDTLIQFGANIELKNNKGFSALMHACQEGKLECSRLLIEANANIDEKSNIGSTALHLAALRGHASILELLLDAGAKLLKDNYGDTPLHDCFGESDRTCAEHFTVSTLLLKYDRSMSFMKNKAGKTAADVYQNHKCRAYSDESRSAQKERLFYILKGVPEEIILRGEAAVENFKLSVEDGGKKMRNVKIMVLGDEHVGKTCITNRLVKKPFKMHEPSTDGIVISKLCRIKPNDTWTVISQEGQAKQLHEQALVESFVETSLKRKPSEAKEITDDTRLDSSTEKTGATFLSDVKVSMEHMDIQETSTATDIEKSIMPETPTATDTEKSIMPDEEKTSLTDFSSEIEETSNATDIQGSMSETSTATDIEKSIMPEMPTATDTEKSIMPDEEKISLTDFSSEIEDLSEQFEDVQENKDVHHRKEHVEMSTSLRTQEEDQKKEIDKMNRELSLPEDLNERVLKYTSTIKPGTGNELSIKIYDFAGQQVYASTHQVFLASKAVYILAFNLLDDLDSNVKHEHIQYSDQTLLNRIKMKLKPFNKVKLKETNLERLHFWLQSIHANGKVGGQAAGQQQLSPPIFIVGTHMNKLSGNKTEREHKLKEIKDKIFLSLEKTPYEGHVVPELFAVENSLDEDIGISELRSHLERVCLGEPYMDFLTPITWLKLLADLEEKRNEGKHCLKLEEVKALAEECQIKGSVHIVLNFFQDIGEVVYFGREEDPDGNLLKENVILDPQWLVDLFRTIITHIHFDEQNAVYVKSWRRLKEEGILEERLADRLWKDVGVSKEFLFEIMNKFYLICEKVFSEKEVRSESSEAGRLFLVPCLFKDFKCNPNELVEKRFPVIRFFMDFHGFLPSGLFHKALVRIISWSQEQGGRDLPLYRKRGEFYVDHAHDMVLQLSPLDKSTVEVMILRVDGQAQDPCKRICRKVYLLLKACFGDICTIWAKGLNYQFAIACDQCKRDKPHLHPFEDCQKPRVPCTKSKRMDVTKYQESFLKEHHQSTCPDCSLCGSDQNPASRIATSEIHKQTEQVSAPAQKEDFQKAAQVSTRGFAVDESIFPRVLLTVSQNIGTDLNIWKVALKDKIMNANTLHKSTEATELFDALRETAILKADDISILLETIRLTGVLRLQKHIPNCPRLDNIEITHFSKFRQSVMAFGMQLIDDDIRLIVQRYELPGQYNDKWSLILDLENNFILADDDKLLDDFKHALDKLGLRRLSRLFEC